MKTVTLSHPIKSINGDDIGEVTIKPVTSAMYLKHGDVARAEVRTNGNTETMYFSKNMDAMRGYLVDCTGLPLPILTQMSMSDMRKCEAVIEGFFQD